MAKVAFLFPGQGAQYVGMAAGLCQALPAARALFDQAADILGYDLLAVCTAGPKDKLDSTVVSQPAIYVASLAALEQLLVRFGQLVLDLPRIKEIDINPLVAGPGGLLALDARVVLHAPAVADTALPRPAIRPRCRSCMAWPANDG